MPVVSGMVALFERLGGTLLLGEPVRAIRVVHERVAGVETGHGFEAFDAVVSNADVVATYGLLGEHARGRREVARLTRASFSPSLFLVHLGARGRWPEVPHHTVLFGPRYGPLLDDIYRHGRVPQDPALYVHHPTATDASLSPAGDTTLYALAPVPHLGHGETDWDAAAPAYRERIIDLLEERLLPGLRSRLTVAFHYTPRDFERDLDAHLGSAFSLEPRLLQSAWFRVHNRDDVLANLYFVGAGTHPGAGIPGVVGSAKATAGLVLADLAREAAA
jgi:phytoene desaturase